MCNKIKVHSNLKTQWDDWNTISMSRSCHQMTSNCTWEIAWWLTPVLKWFSHWFRFAYAVDVHSDDCYQLCVNKCTVLFACNHDSGTVILEAVRLNRLLYRPSHSTQASKAQSEYGVGGWGDGTKLEYFERNPRRFWEELRISAHSLELRDTTTTCCTTVSLLHTDTISSISKLNKTFIMNISDY